MSKIMRIIQNRSLLQQLSAIIMIVVIVPILVIGIITTQISVTALKEQSQKSKAALSAQTADMIDQELERMEQLFLQITLSNTFKDVIANLEMKAGLDEKESAEWNLNRKKIVSALDKDIQSVTIANKLINNLTILWVSGDVIGPKLTVPEGITDIRLTKTFQSLIERDTLSMLMPAEADLYMGSNALTMGKALNSSFYSTDKPVAAIVMELNYNELQKIIIKTKSGDEDSAYIIASNGSIISGSAYEEALEQSTDPVFAEVMERSHHQSADTFTTRVNNRDTIVTYNRCNQSGFIYMVMVPESEVLAGSNKIRNIILALGIGFSVLAVLGGIVFSRGITKALIQVEKTMAKAAQGDLTVLAQSKRKDEIGKVATSFNTMVTSIRHLIVQSKEVSQEVNKNAQSLSDISNQSSRAASEVAIAINDVANGASQQSEEVDLSVRTFSNLAQEITDVVIRTQHMSESANQVKNFTSDGMRNAQILNSKAIQVIAITADVVLQISGLAKSIAQINDFTEILNVISAQTRLLSLNASIEAARAGEHGRGFMVVAEEIRKLAEQSGQQTSQIDAVVSGILAQTAASTKLVKKADESIQSQVEAVKESTKYLTNIESSTNELLQNIDQIIQVIETIDKDKDSVLNSINRIASVSELAAASSEEVSASTQEQLSSLEELTNMALLLSTTSQNLEESLLRFKVE